MFPVFPVFLLTVCTYCLSNTAHCCPPFRRRAVSKYEGATGSLQARQHELRSGCGPRYVLNGCFPNADGHLVRGTVTEQAQLHSSLTGSKHASVCVESHKLEHNMSVWSLFALLLHAIFLQHQDKSWMAYHSGLVRLVTWSHSNWWKQAVEFDGNPLSRHPDAAVCEVLWTLVLTYLSLPAATVVGVHFSEIQTAMENVVVVHVYWDYQFLSVTPPHIYHTNGKNRHTQRGDVWQTCYWT